MGVIVTLRFHHGGSFRKNKLGSLEYVDGGIRTFPVDPDELCWWYLVELVGKCGGYNAVDQIYYLLPGKKLENGLLRVYNDQEVLEMGAIAIKERCVDLFVKHCIDEPELILFLDGTDNPNERGTVNEEGTEKGS